MNDEMEPLPAAAGNVAPRQRSAKSKRERALRRLASRLLTSLGSALIFVLLIGFWELVVAAGWVDEIILPHPDDVGGALIDTFQDDFFYDHLWVTTHEVVVGFLIGSAIGLFFGVLLGASRIARAVGYPYVVGFQGLPKVVLAPVFVTAFGFGITSKIAMAVAICFFPVLINTLVALESVDPEAMRLMRSLTAARHQVFLKLVLPHSLPLVFGGLKTGLTLALVGAIVGEFSGASEGLGYLLLTYSYQLQIDRVYAIMIILAGLGVVLFLALELIDRKLVFWRTERGLSASA